MPPAKKTLFDDVESLTAYPPEICEMALAHTIGDATEAAYRRGDVFAKRARLMGEWAKYCEAPKRSGKVAPLVRRKVS